MQILTAAKIQRTVSDVVWQPKVHVLFAKGNVETGNFHIFF